MADLSVTNISPNTLTIQTQDIAAGASYSVPFANLVAWAEDPYLRAYVLGGMITISVLGVVLRYKDANDWLDSVAAGTIVYAS